MNASPDTASEHLDFDVVVVGCGIAGLSAAVSALEKGATVAILERSVLEDRGGQTRWTEAFMRMKSDSEVADDLESHYAENAGHHLDPELVGETARDYENWPSIVKVLNFTDPELVATLAEKAGPTLQWMKGYGIQFDFSAPGFFITTCTTRISPVGGGLALVEALAAAAEQRGAKFFYQTTARTLVTDETGQVRGLEAAGERNRLRHFTAGSVVLASGGFQGNAEMLTRYIGPKARYLRPVARGGYHNKGEGIRMALAAGAAPAGDFGELHAEPLDPRSGAPEPLVLVFNYGILVNTHGERFTDEAPSTVDATYEAITRQILDQPGGIAWTVLDAGIDDVPNWQKSVRSDQPPVSAPTLGELAEKIDVPGDALARTVADFNAACREGPFDPLALDGLATAPGFGPRKSNWARPVTRDRFSRIRSFAAIASPSAGSRSTASAKS